VSLYFWCSCHGAQGLGLDGEADLAVASFARPQYAGHQGAVVGLDVSRSSKEFWLTVLKAWFTYRQHEICAVECPLALGELSKRATFKFESQFDRTWKNGTCKGSELDAY